MKLKICFGFLEEIKKRFREKYSNEEIMIAKTYDMSTSFAETFKNQMVIFCIYLGTFNLTIDRLTTTVHAIKTKNKSL